MGYVPFVLFLHFAKYSSGSPRFPETLQNFRRCSNILKKCKSFTHPFKIIIRNRNERLSYRGNCSLLLKRCPKVEGKITKKQKLQKVATGGNRWQPVLIDTRWSTTFKTCFFTIFIHQQSPFTGGITFGKCSNIVL